MVLLLLHPINFSRLVWSLILFVNLTLLGKWILSWGIASLRFTCGHACEEISSLLIGGRGTVSSAIPGQMDLTVAEQVRSKPVIIILCFSSWFQVPTFASMMECYSEVWNETKPFPSNLVFAIVLSQQKRSKLEQKNWYQQRGILLWLLGLGLFCGRKEWDFEALGWKTHWVLRAYWAVVATWKIMLRQMQTMFRREAKPRDTSD